MTTTEQSNDTNGWDELRRFADQLDLEIHLGGMEARDLWREAQPRLAEVERQIREAGGRIGHTLTTEIAYLRDLLRGLKDGLAHPGN